MSEQIKLRPRVAEAVRVWDALPTADRKYKAVAERMNITEGRAAVYVREGLVALGRGDETPRGNGGERRIGGTQVSEPVAQMEALIEQNRETVERLQAEINEAQESAATFDAEKFIAEEEARLRKARDEAEARLNAWSTDADEIATKAATEEEKRLNERATKILDDHEQQLAVAQRAIEAFESSLAALIEAEEASAPTTGETA